MRMCDAPLRTSLTGLGVFAASTAPPEEIQLRRIAYSGLLASKRMPPSCGIAPVAFFSIKLDAGSCASIRRPSIPCVSATRSISASSPRSENRNPPLPLKFPWQAPALHPARDSTAMTSFWNETGLSAAEMGEATASNRSGTQRIGAALKGEFGGEVMIAEGQRGR